MGVRITPKDIERFTDGDCDVLAHELHQITGWPIYSLHCGDRKSHELHAFVLAPGKIAVDIQGPRPVRQLVQEWEDAGAKGYVRGGWPLAAGECCEGSRRRARKVAPHLISLVKVDGS